MAGNINSDAAPNGFSELESPIGGDYGPSNSSRPSFTGKCLSSKANSKSRNSKYCYYMFVKIVIEAYDLQILYINFFFL